MSNRVYLIYDGRASSVNTDNALVMEICSSLNEAKRNMRSYGRGCVIFSYEEINSALTDEHWEYTDPIEGD